MFAIRSKLTKINFNSIPKLLNCRHLSTNNEHKSDFHYSLPPLMKFRPKGMPNIFYSFKNQFIIHFYLKPLIDRQFNTKHFMDGAKQALTVISSNLAEDNIEGIRHMVTEEAYKEVSENFKEYTLEQKQQLKVSIEDIILSFPYNIEIQRNSPDSAVVKIFVVYDCIPGFSQLAKSETLGEFNKFFTKFDIKTYLDTKVLCNYEFIRHYIKGVESEWIVNKLMHIKDKDIIQMYGLFKHE